MTATVGVLGAGVMGGGIAQVLAVAGFDTVCYDPDAAALGRARENVAHGHYGLDGAVERGRATRADADAALARLTFTDTFEAATERDLVIEAVPEHLSLKVAVFRDLDRMCPPETVLATNTSGFPVIAMAAATNRAARVIGWHWASPPVVMKLAEIVRTRQTSDETVEFVRSVALACGKHPVVINDTDQHWGFAANRIYFAMIREAEQVVREGIATNDDIDQLMMDCFRWPTGPFGMVKGATTGW
jgi:3-hydroxybutyryl-CoA dehydrogenase